MKKLLSTSALAIAMLAGQQDSFAGNKDRSGQAGAIQLLNNPWAGSTGVFGLDVAQIRGVQSMKVNIAGLARSAKTEIGIGYNEHLIGTNIRILSLGFAQKLNDFGVLGVNIQTTNTGDIKIVDADNPEEGIGTFNPSIFNATIGFAKTFSDRIHAGVSVTFVSEGVNDAKASGACFDAGIQYVTGARDNFHFGITLRNVGTYMRFSGDGFSSQVDANGDYIYQVNRSTPTARVEMPTYLNIGLAYDFYLDGNKLQNENDEPKHRLTVMGDFTSNSFINDYLGVGFEYGFKETFMLRAAYRYEQGITKESTSLTFYTGLSAGATIQTRLGKEGPLLALDYSYRPTRRPNNGCHGFGLRFMR